MKLFLQNEGQSFEMYLHTHKANTKTLDDNNQQTIEAQRNGKKKLKQKNTPLQKKLCHNNNPPTVNLKNNKFSHTHKTKKQGNK